VILYEVPAKGVKVPGGAASSARCCRLLGNERGELIKDRVESSAGAGLVEVLEPVAVIGDELLRGAKRRESVPVDVFHRAVPWSLVGAELGMAAFERDANGRA
jgi:hypothetical protein